MRWKRGRKRMEGNQEGERRRRRKQFSGDERRVDYIKDGDWQR